MDIETFDLGSIVVQDTTELEILHPQTDKPTGWKITLAGPGHPVTQEIGNDAARERLKLEREQDAARVNGRKWKPDAADPEAERLRILGRVAKRILGWSPVNLNGSPFPYTAENALDLLTNPQRVWAGNQVVERLGEDASFIGSSAAT
ncbi:hypothetical protein [Roseococcus sp. YIM B11640]|uniref:hypothetical protein n=1 Tax=Roseococcus sp. YIM B11640 TaxID=3133973 RepID=UPI003C79AF03